SRRPPRRAHRSRRRSPADRAAPGGAATRRTRRTRPCPHAGSCDPPRRQSYTESRALGSVTRLAVRGDEDAQRSRHRPVLERRRELDDLAVERDLDGFARLDHDAILLEPFDERRAFQPSKEHGKHDPQPRPTALGTRDPYVEHAVVEVLAADEIPDRIAVAV